MTESDYFDAHLPHRVNLLTTFRERYSGRQPSLNLTYRPAQAWDQPRDFFRCAKDMSILMVRFFCDEMGLFLPEGEIIPKDRAKRRDGAVWQPRFKSLRFLAADAQKDTKKYVSLVEVLKAANRAVAHIDTADVDHGFRTRDDHEALFDVIDWIENLVQTRIYGPNDRVLKQAMQLDKNVI